MIRDGGRDDVDGVARAWAAGDGVRAPPRSRTPAHRSPRRWPSRAPCSRVAVQPELGARPGVVARPELGARLGVVARPELAARPEVAAHPEVVARPEIVAFAVATASRDGDPCDAEVRFLGVAPDHWGEGLGARVMYAILERLEQRGDRSASLLVYVDNLPAIRLYERCGWVAADDPPSLHPTSGRLEQRYLRTLGGPSRG